MCRVAIAAFFHFVTLIVLMVTTVCPTNAQSVPKSLDEVLQAADVAMLAREARLRGDPHRGALLFYKSAAGCVKCHASGQGRSPLGPDLAHPGDGVTDEHVIESILWPSKKLRKGYETVRVITLDGKLVSGLLVEDNKDALVLRNAANLEEEINIPKGEIDETMTSPKSMMPDGLVSSLRSPREFYDLARYVMEVADGGQARAAALKPTPKQLAVKDDTKNLDHAGILARLGKRDFAAGQKFYRSLCVNCHGPDGNTPSLPTARAFGTQELKFGADPYSMFRTLSHGNGLMAPMLYLSPKERYQVIHYIREQFMNGRNPGYVPIDKAYLADLPKGTENGEAKPRPMNEFGPALASQLGREVNSALTIKLRTMTISYNLHTMQQAGVWQGGFLDLEATQHMRGRGEGVPTPQGTRIEGLSGWQWGHEGTLDFPREGLLPRGPLPAKWLDYRGHYLHDEDVVLSYKIDGRDVLELPQQLVGMTGLQHTLRIGPGKALMLAVAQRPKAEQMIAGVLFQGDQLPKARKGPATESIVLSGTQAGKQFKTFTAAAVLGDTEDLFWETDEEQRLLLRIPADRRERLIDVICHAGTDNSSLRQFQKHVASLETLAIQDPKNMRAGSAARWPDVLSTVGDPGLQQGAYVLDTITLPESTPWNTWFRTSALDFFPDGRMVVSTHGGDIWIASGVDDKLLKLQWKRFAGGLYEPFGLKVVDGKIYVTCKDRLTRLHDLNNDGEADFYESFSADTDVSTFFHAFNFDLQTDTKGNFYYAKSGQYTDFALPGAVIKVSPDGKQREVYCTGFRTPNGMGILPDDRLTASDNQGNWMPASKVSLLKSGGFYGYVQTHARGSAWSPDGGRIDHTKVVPPKTFDQPLIWMPQNFDNSSGGQLWVDDPRWGPLSNRLLHTSFGKGWLSYMMIQDFDNVSQAAIIKLPFDFCTGIMRARVNPKDGQVYATGLDGWNGNGRPGLLDRGIQRLRYTGKPIYVVTDCQVEHDGLRLSFNFPLDSATAQDVNSYVGQCWNYHWRAAYGSETFSPKTDKPGKDDLEITAATLSTDGKSIKLAIADLRPVNQVHLILTLKARDGQPFHEEMYWTINKVPLETR